MPDLTPPEACGSMTELRAAIDVLDARLVAMLALRQTYIERAAILKSERGAVRDAARIAQVVRNVGGSGPRRPVARDSRSRLAGADRGQHRA